MADPFKIITRLNRENERQVKLIDELNVVIKNQADQAKQYVKDMQEIKKEVSAFNVEQLVKAENEKFIDQIAEKIDQITEKTAVCAKVIDAASDTVKQTIVEAIK